MKPFDDRSVLKGVNRAVEQDEFGTREPSRATGVTLGPSDNSPEALLFTVGEVGELLRTSRKAIYAMAERGQLPGVTRIGRRLLFRRDLLVDWIRQKSASSLEGKR